MADAIQPKAEASSDEVCQRFTSCKSDQGLRSLCTHAPQDTFRRTKPEMPFYSFSSATIITEDKIKMQPTATLKENVSW